MTQVELVIWGTEGDSFISIRTVGYVETKFAQKGKKLAIGKRTWIVNAVWATTNRRYVAWWYKATEVKDV
jgi:hypothetical protein